MYIYTLDCCRGIFFGSCMVRIVLFSLSMVLLAACGTDWSVGPDGCDGSDWSVGPSSNGGSVDRSYRYYYVADCRYDSFGAYDCSDDYALPQSVSVRIQITYDGYATLNWDGYIRYYSRGEYSEGYDAGDYYYQFYGDDWELTIYENGSEMIFVDEWEGTATYYYYDIW